MAPEVDPALILLGGLAQRGEEPFGEGVAAEEERGIEGVAGEGVPEKRDAGDVAGEEAGGGGREAAEELPDGKIGDEEELDGAKERGEADARDGAAIAEPESDDGVDDEHQFVETDEKVAGEESKQREQERETAIAEQGAREERHRANGSEVPRMRSDAQGRGENNQDESEQG